MTTLVITPFVKDELKAFLKESPKSDLLTAYLFFLSKKLSINPILFVKEKTIYRSEDELIKRLEEEGKLYRETEIKIQFSQASVNEETKKIYICPYSGKAFGDNTYANPLDAIYDWVSKCPENTERVGGLKAKKFFVSEDVEVIKNYIQKRKEPIKKIVFSSVATGKLYNSKKAVIDNFKKSYFKPIPLIEVPHQNRYQIEDHLLQFIQNEIEESKISAFVEAVSEIKELAPYATQWIET
ncbi:MAG: DUF2709 domain-containing protein [Simkaniaceae bacterium]|nr:DUF2709 domain-containing protein [Simkaniaceae bacterium]